MMLYSFLNIFKKLKTRLEKIMENFLNEYDVDMDLSSSDSFINENDENVILSGETVVIGNITILELAGIFLITSVILSKFKITKKNF
jgi:hypothetical protein